MKTGIQKKALAILLVTASILMSACGSKTYSINDLPKMKVEKYVILPEYKGLAVTVDPKQEVTDDMVTYYIRSKMNEDQQFHQLTGKVANGDTVDISYVGTIDGKAFDGGTADDQLLVIGSNSYIEGFESGLVGTTVGNTATLNLTFPKDYSNTDLAGKACVFTVTVNYILQPLSDANVNKVDKDYKDAASYQAAIKTLLVNYYNSQYEYNVKSAIASKLLEGCTFKDIPQSLIDSFKAEQTDYLTGLAKNNGTDLNTYMEQQYGIAAADVDTKITEAAENDAKEGIAFQAIANQEKLNVSDADLSAEMTSQASAAGYTSVDEMLGTDGDPEDIRVNMMYDKVYNFLESNAKITENTK